MDMGIVTCSIPSELLIYRLNLLLLTLLHFQHFIFHCFPVSEYILVLYIYIR